MAKILIFLADIFEDLELLYPKYRLMEEGYQVDLAAEKKDYIYKAKHGYPCQADVTLDEVNVDDYIGLVIPGGYAPDKLRKLPKALEIIKKFDEQNKLIAFICHAGWVPISAKVVKGVTLTSTKTIKDDLENAGAIWIDEPVVIDRHFITSRTPEDLPKFLPAMINYLKNASTMS